MALMQSMAKWCVPVFITRSKSSLPTSYYTYTRTAVFLTLLPVISYNSRTLNHQILELDPARL